MCICKLLVLLEQTLFIWCIVTICEIMFGLQMITECAIEYETYRKQLFLLIVTDGVRCHMGLGTVHEEQWMWGS